MRKESNDSDLAGQFTAYARLESGSILVAGALAIDGP